MFCKVFLSIFVIFIAFQAGIIISLGGSLAMFGATYDVNDIPSQEGRTIVITGSTSGIGLESAVELAKKGGNIIMTARNPARGEAALQRVRKEAPGASVDMMELDLSSLASAAHFADELRTRVDKIDVLMLNAGIMLVPFSLTKDGFESTYQVDHLGHFLIVQKLMDMIKESKTRVVTVSSKAHEGTDGVVYFDRLTSDKDYSALTAYLNAKFCNVLFSNELARRLAGTGATSNSLHPGVVATGLTQPVKQSIRSFFSDNVWEAAVLPVMDFIESIIALTSLQGALTQLYVATSPDLATTTGRYFIPIAKHSEPIAGALNETLAADLWAVSEEQTRAFMST